MKADIPTPRDRFTPATLLVTGATLLTLALGACSPDRSLTTGSPKPPEYCPCDIPPAPPPNTQSNLL